MTRVGLAVWALGASSLLLAGATGCTAPGGPESAVPWGTDGAGVGSQGDGGSLDTLSIRTSALCTTPHASEVLTPRVDLMGMAPVASGVVQQQRVIHTSDVFARFNTICGRCHVDTSNGGRQLTAATFSSVFDETWLASITSDDPLKAMPPENRGYSSRPPDDPVRQLVYYLNLWLAAGRPADLFAIDVASDSDGAGAASTGSMGYTFTPDMASAMTNLGTCIPNKDSYANSPSTEMEAKDAMFSAATELPSALSDTDLVTFDAATLAANGVIAYVPTYPLWSDGSGKLRHIRVPKGTSIVFDKAKQTFDIPPNTRFYKTFFREVTDIAGHKSHRKIETRVIVARPQQKLPDGTFVQTALFGTYLWTEDETAAYLHDLPYRDGTPFADRTLEYVTDEVQYSQVLDSVPAGSSSGFSTRLAKGLEKFPGLVQHYAIPGKNRCVQCHMGSPTFDFILGFFPLQVARRPNGQAGTYEPTGDDELNQLQRLIDYGLITGMDSPADVTALEDSQLPRRARTPQELAAQAYMVGNCAHCHNPHGFPSITKPELTTALNFMPGSGTDGGGVFEFPLTRMSPVRARGTNGDVPIPYITPSLRDYPVANTLNVRMDSGVQIDPGSTAEKTWSPKYSLEAEANAITNGCAEPDSMEKRAFCKTFAPDGKVSIRQSGHTFVSAPWRSLIYRNVDAAFPYYDDFVPFPHMPMNSVGFDQRAPRLMGDWMVSLPAIRVNPGVSEDLLPSEKAKAHDGSYDDAPQPYVEVKPGDAAYPSAVLAAKARLDEYHAGIRYNYREEVLGTDILDPVPSGSYHPDPLKYLFGGDPPRDPSNPTDLAFPAIGVPFHSHWFNYDPTDSPGQWQPRRGDAWKGVLVDKVPDTAIPGGQIGVDTFTADDRRLVTEALAAAKLTDALRTYARTSVPYGLWQVKPECQSKLADKPKVSQIQNPTLWMATTPAATPDAPVFMMAPGQALYRHICFNCHGPRADGRGLQADALAAASEGQARPANFMTGLFGPVDHQGDNLRSVFGGDNQETRDAAEVTTAAEDLGSRYMAWMALGGTLQYIPTDIIHQVEASRILGEPRPKLANLKVASTASANMLTLAKGLCAIVLPDPNGFLPALEFISGGHAITGNGANNKTLSPAYTSEAPLVKSNGDFEMWVRLCSQFSRPVVRVYGPIFDKTDSSTKTDIYHVGATKYLYGESYPVDALVWDQDLKVQTGIKTDQNFFPTCLDTSDQTQSGAHKETDAFQSQQTMPPCPSDFIKSAEVMWSRTAGDTDAAEQQDKIAKWTLNGAITAGMAVFSYLRDADLLRKQAPPYFNECQLLP